MDTQTCRSTVVAGEGAGGPYGGMFSIRLHFAVLAALCLSACSTGPDRRAEVLARIAAEEAAPAVVVTDETIGAIESRIEMPPGARPLAEYDRYYSGVRLSGREGVQGVLLLRRWFGDINRDGVAPVEGMANVYRGGADALPIVSDGGCAVVTLYFDLAAQEFVELHREGLSVERARAVCNGVA